MSQITVLGFTPSHPISSSQGANAIHWSILLTSTPGLQDTQKQSPATTRPKAKSFFSSHRRLSRTDRNTPASTEIALFDMHNHQLRRQEFPVPIRAQNSTETYRTTTSITSDIPNKPFTLSLRILLSTHSLPVSKLAQKLSTLLYRTPTYGPEEDWFRAALDMLVVSGILEPAQSYDGDSVLAFAGEAVKECLTQIEQGHQRESEVLELDYAKHIREMELVRAIFSHSHPTAQQPAQTTTAPGARPRPRTNSSHHYFNFHHHSKPKTNANDVPIKTHKFLGFRVAPSPSAYSPRQRWSGSGRRAYFERQDDPYGGLM